MRLVIIGNGMAATRLIASLTGRVPGRFAVTVIGDEPEQAYNRIQLSPVLGGEKQAEHICLHDEDWYTARGVTVLRGETALAVDVNAREVHTSARTLGWDALVFATGSTPVVPPIPGGDAPHVFTFRTSGRNPRHPEYLRAGGSAGRRRTRRGGSGSAGAQG